MQFSGGGCDTTNNRQQQQETTQKNKKQCLPAPGSATTSPVLHRKGLRVHAVRPTVCAFTINNHNTYDSARTEHRYHQTNNTAPLSAFQSSKEDFHSYLDRCFGHQLVDLSAKHPGNTSYSSGYVNTFVRKWQDHDPTLCGFVKCSNLVILMDDLAIANYHHDVNNDDIFINFFEGKDKLVSLRQFANFTERFDVQDANAHVGEAEPAVHESSYTLGHCLGHLAIDLGVAATIITKHCMFQSTYVVQELKPPTSGRATQQLDVATRDRMRWYIEAWLKRCGVGAGHGASVASSASLSASTKMPKLHYAQVMDLLKEAVIKHRFSRFAQRGSRGYIKQSVAEAAAMLKVQTHTTHIDFMDFCTVVEAPEPCVCIPNFSLSARITTLVPWRPLFHSLFNSTERSTVHTMLLILQRLKSTHFSLTNLQDVWITHILGCGQWLE